MNVFKQLFSTMNDVLEEIAGRYPLAEGHERKDLEDQLAMLKSMSDVCIEEWLLFEEKMGKLVYAGKPQPEVPACVATLMPAAVQDEEANESFARGQGYYKLYMFTQAVEEFEKLVRQQPDFLLARIYLAMGYLRLGEYGEAYRHFQFLLPLTDNSKIRAITYNAMGCIHAQNQNMDKAYEYFKMAYRSDPTCVDAAFQLVGWTKRQ